MHDRMQWPMKLVATIMVVIAAITFSAKTASAQVNKDDADQIVANASNGDPVRACGVGQSHSAAIVGLARDMVWIYADLPGTYLSPSFKDALRDGKNLRCEFDVHYGSNFIAVRYGEKRDLWALYGIKADGTVVAAKIELRDGQHHDLIDSQAEYVGKDEFLVVYGTKKDRSMRFCFDGDIWTRSPAARASYPADCHLTM